MTNRRLVPFRGPAFCFAAFLLVQAVSAAALFASKLGGSAAGVEAFYLGAPDRFAAPKSAAGLLEVAVPHLAAIPLVLFAAVHVVGFARALPRRAFSALVTLSFGSALAGVAAGFGVRWIAPGFAWLKVAAFAGLEVSLLTWAALLVALFLPRPHAASAVHGAARERRVGEAAR